MKVNGEHNLIDQIQNRYCENCKKEYQFEIVVEKYPEFYHDRLIELWQNSQIRFFCPYCYLLEFIRFFKKE